MEHLIQAIQHGDQDAFNALIEAEKPKLLAKAYSYVGNKEDAADIVQESLLLAYQHIHQLKEPKYFSTWLFKICIRQCFSFLRQRKKTLVVEFDIASQPFTEDATESYDFVHEAIATLQQDYQTTLVLFYFYEFKIQEIAQLINKPVNTVKMHLHRGRIQLKKQLQQITHKTFEQKEVVHMLKEQLASIAFRFVSVPENFTLLVEDYSHDEATFMWAAEELDDGIKVTLDKDGKLLSLTKPAAVTKLLLSLEQQQQLAESFLNEQYPKALQYLTLHDIQQRDDQTKFIFEQLVGGYPLASYQTRITVSASGEIINFSYKGYTTTPPTFPTSLVSTDVVFKTIQNANWQLAMKYFASDFYSVTEPGLHPIYESPIVYESFLATTGDAYIGELEEDEELLKPFPTIEKMTAATTLEEIIGVTSNMTKLREVEMDEQTIGIVWGQSNSTTATDKSMESFIGSRYENTVKAKVDQKSKKLLEFMWFKERTGTLDLSFEMCEKIACSFIATYFEEYLPYLQMHVKEPSFNVVQRAFFTFPVQTMDGHIIPEERFYIGVNKTTGLIDILWAPKIPVEQLQNYVTPDILPLEQATTALNNLELYLQWRKDYENEQRTERLYYKLGKKDTNEQIIGIHAVTGELIYSKI